jgi:hypothetical protein
MAHRSLFDLGARRVAASLVACLLALPALAAAAPPPGADSPQALVARMRAALAKKDFPEMVACMAPQDRREMAFGLLIGSTMMLAFMDMGSEMAMGMAEGMAEGMTEGMTGEEPSAAQKAEKKAEMDKAKAEAKKVSDALKERHAAILRKHGLAERMESGMSGGEADTPEQAMAKLMAGVDEGALIADLMAFFEAMPDEDGKKSSQLMELPEEVTGYAIDGDHATAKSGDETIEFVRVDGRWYFKPTSKEDAAEESEGS